MAAPWCASRFRSSARRALKGRPSPPLQRLPKCGEIARALMAALGNGFIIWYKLSSNAHEAGERYVRTILSKHEKVGLFPLSLFVRG